MLWRFIVDQNPTHYPEVDSDFSKNTKMEFLALLFVLISSRTAFAQLPWPGDCPNIQPVQNFSLSQYSGNWFEAERYFFLPELTGSCVSVNYTLNADGSLNTQIRFTESISNLAMVWPGKINLVNPAVNPENSSGNLQITVGLLNPFVPQTGIQQTYNCKVVATDYTTYAIHWSCYSFLAFHFKSVWVLSRDQTYPASVRRNVRNQLASLGINEQMLQRTDQNCITENVG